MSSLAATQADGMYIPPSYLESGAYKSKSINQFAGSKGHNQYLQRSVCRFELPFDGFCTACDAIVGKGTRFNAHKAHVDDYFTTKIYEFTTRCRACGNCEFKIRTNPKERTFDYTSGIRKKVEEFDSAEAGTHGVIDTEIGNGILQYKNGKVLDDDGTGNTATTTSALHLLEKNVTGHRKAQTEHEHMTSLLELNSKMVEDADANASVRASFRKDRKAKKRRLGEAVKKGLGRGIEMLSGGMEEDATLAKQAMDGRRRRREGGRAHRSELDKFRSVRTGSIFGSERSSSKRKSSSRRSTTKTEKLERKRTDANETKPVQKQKITIHHQISASGSRKRTKDETAVAIDNSALAALSSFYASDSD
mmetsp:Transcript_26787/g.48566  ORF Transcript_26787/g.48566 Transcript_26787/m.48566 type:complete len:363 (+) Transcript_26787:18-1106(+)